MSFDENAIAKNILPFRREIVAGEAKLIRESIDGRRLYKYRISPEKLDALEDELSKPKCTDAARLMILAPLAAGRFSANYEGGPPRWEDCGKAISKLYKPGDARFKSLMTDSLKKYGITVLSRDNKDLLLETLIRESGLPSPMLADGKPLRKLLDTLMDRAARGEDALEVAASLVDEDNDLPKRYKDPELPQLRSELLQLCAELVNSVWLLKRDADWNGGSLDPIWNIPQWERKLPFLVPERRARDIVGRLLDVAESAAESAPLSIERTLCEVSDGWKLGARIAFPVRGQRIEHPKNLPEISVLHYTVDGEVTDEACRIRKQGVDQLYRLARASSDLSELLASPSRTLSLSIRTNEGTQELLDRQGGERLDPALPWIFIARSDKKHVYLDSGNRRSRASELLVAVLPDTAVSGAAMLEPGTLEVPMREGEQAQKRLVWRVKGVTELRWPDGEARIEAGYTGPDVHLQFIGRAAIVDVKGCSGAFIGDPKPRRVGGHSGKIQWRPMGANQWSIGSNRTTGKVTYRLVDDKEVELAKRNVFIFPESFNYKIRHKYVELTLGDGFTVVGNLSQANNTWRIDFGAKSFLMISVDTPSGVIELSFEKPQPTAFRHVATGEQFVGRDHTISARFISGLVARSNQHNHIQVRRKDSPWNAMHSFALVDNQLRLSQINSFLKALAFSHRGRTHSLKVEFQNHAGLNIEAFRIVRKGNNIFISGAGPEMNIELLELAPDRGHPPDHRTLKSVDQESWAIPDLREGSLYLAIDSSRQASPCLVMGPVVNEKEDARTFIGCIAIADKDERLKCLLDLFQKITALPNDGFNSGQIDDCLQWLGRFQSVLQWLDPFLVLVANPVLAHKMLVLARLRNNTQSLQGLLWGLDEVPLFWHRLRMSEGVEILEWADREFASKAREVVRDLLEELPLQRMLQQLSKSPALFQKATYEAWRDQWQVRALQWSDLANGQIAARSASIGLASSALWNILSESHELRSLLESRCQQVPNSIEDIHRTYLLAPFELALCVASQLEIPPVLQDDLIYARYAISPDDFDNAYCIAVTLMERMK